MVSFDQQNDGYRWGDDDVKGVAVIYVWEALISRSQNYKIVAMNSVELFLCLHISVCSVIMGHRDPEPFLTTSTDYATTTTTTTMIIIVTIIIIIVIIIISISVKRY